MVSNNPMYVQCSECCAMIDLTESIVCPHCGKTNSQWAPSAYFLNQQRKQVGTPISMSDALKLSDKILEDAENSRKSPVICTYSVTVSIDREVIEEWYRILVESNIFDIPEVSNSKVSNIMYQLSNILNSNLIVDEDLESGDLVMIDSYGHVKKCKVDDNQEGDK